MAAKLVGAANLHNVFLAHAHRRFSLTPDSAFTALEKCSAGPAKNEQGPNLAIPANSGVSLAPNYKA